MKPDIICVHSDSVDYPLWREFLDINSAKFGKVFVGMTKANYSTNYMQFVNTALTQQGIIVITDTNLLPGHDWRSSAVNKCLALSQSEHVLFLEQDFLFHDETLLDKILNLEVDLFGFKEHDRPGDRMHPAFMIVKRSLLNQSCLNFSAGNGLDHFGQVSRELEALCQPLLLNQWNPTGWEHLAGLNHNYHLLISGKPPVYQAERFSEYNKTVQKCARAHASPFYNIIDAAAKLS